mmetsp:Transcript_8499/g.12681  ORF Transcript_8499/g.12681 Transcript_8499/m.12681 type:complete len:299 (+) Transcript_8499:40-936(+)
MIPIFLLFIISHVSYALLSPDFSGFQFNVTDLNTALSYRCRMESTASYTQKVIHSHNPKTAGTTVNKFFRRESIRPFHLDTGHVSYSVFQKKHNDPPGHPYIYVSILRYPQTRVLSYFHFIYHNRHRIPPQWRGDVIWENAFKYKSLSKWLSTPSVRKYLSDEYSRILDASVDAIDRVRTWSPVSVPNTFFQSTSHAPEHRQCHAHLRSAALLLMRYTVVGITENMKETFWPLLFRRVSSLPQSEYNSAVNSSTGSNSKVKTEEEKAMVQKELGDVLYCERLLYEIAKAVNEADRKCS